MTDVGDGAGDDRMPVAPASVDHAAPAVWDGSLDDPLALASLSRELGVNDPQNDIDAHRGAIEARNTELLVQAPPVATDPGGGDDEDDDTPVEEPPAEPTNPIQSLLSSILSLLGLKI